MVQSVTEKCVLCTFRYSQYIHRDVFGEVSDSVPPRFNLMVFFYPLLGLPNSSF